MNYPENYDLECLKTGVPKLLLYRNIKSMYTCAVPPSNAINYNRH